MRRLVGLVVLAASLLVSAPVAAEIRGLHLQGGPADAAGCHALDLYRGSTLIREWVARDPQNGDTGLDACGFNSWTRLLPNGRLVWDWEYELPAPQRGDPSARSQVWASDGTVGGTQQLHACSQDKVADVTPYPQQVVVGQTLYLDAGEQLCANGVQTAATRGSKDTTFTLPSSSGFMPIGNRVVFDGYGKKGQKGRNELWVSSGTRKSTHLLVDIWPGYPGSDPTDFVSYGTYVTFTADDGTGRAKWITDGTAKGTHKVNG